VEKSHTPNRPRAPKPLELDPAQIPPLLDRIRGRLDEGDLRLIEAAFATLLTILGMVEKGKASLRRLKKLLFGPRTEKASQLLATPEASRAPRRKPKGHGRKGADDYPGATRIPVSHPELKPGNACPDVECPGTLYRLHETSPLLRFRSQHPPVQAEIYDHELLRCAICGKVYRAPTPEGVGDEKCDPSAAAMIAVLRYGAGLPMNRLACLQASLGVPLPPSTQWDILNEAAGPVEPALEELIRQGAQAKIVHNDDTPMKILALMGKRAQAEQKADLPLQTDETSDHAEQKGQQAAEKGPSQKRSVFTSGLVLIRESVKILLFFTGPKHAGENFAEVLKRRAAELPPPIHMCDALSRNVPKLPKTLEMILAHCLTHGRRQFVDVLDHFPDQCRYVIEILAKVYRNDEIARDEAMSPEDRLAFHQAKSGPLMDELHDWLIEQRDQKTVEPNSGLGQAIAYMLKHWLKLTVFLRVPGAPIDNNVCERALKKAILHRKNSLFYKTQHGADVGDRYMSLIATTQANGGNPLTYLTEILRHPNELKANPAAWMPWNYTEALAKLGQPQATAPPPPLTAERESSGAAPPPPGRPSPRPKPDRPVPAPASHAVAPSAPLQPAT